MLLVSLSKILGRDAPVEKQHQRNAVCNKKETNPAVLLVKKKVPKVRIKRTPCSLSKFILFDAPAVHWTTGPLTEADSAVKFKLIQFRKFEQAFGSLAMSL